MPNKTQKTKDADLAKQLIAGIGKHFPTASSLAFASASITPAEVTQRLQTLVSLRTDVNNAKATTKAKVALENAQSPALVALMGELVSFVRTTFSKSPDVLADFGLTPKKARTPPTVEKKAAAAAKRAATRKARMTMGKVQKKEVVGDVVGVTVTPVTAPKPIASGPAASAPVTTGVASGGTTPRGA
jgi:hypothetical protein